MIEPKYPMEIYESYLPETMNHGYHSQECVDRFVEYRMCYNKQGCDYNHAFQQYDHCLLKHTRRLDNTQVHFAANFNPLISRKNSISDNLW